MIALTDGGQEFVASDFNRSFAGLAARAGVAPLIGSAAALLLWVWALWIYRDVQQTVALSIVSGLFASPLSWSFYFIAAVPAAAVIGQHLLGRRRGDLPVVPAGDIAPVRFVPSPADHEDGAPVRVRLRPSP